MSSIASRYGEWSDAVATGCERLVHPCVSGQEPRRNQRRFIGVMLSAPFLAAGAAVVVVTAHLGASTTLAVICASVGLCWLTALMVAANGRMTFAGSTALALGSLGLAGLIAASGGLASPIALLVLALPVEALWIGGTRRSVLAGGIAACAAVALQFVSGEIFLSGAAEPQAWHWLLPLAWSCTLAPRLGGFGIGKASQDEAPAPAVLETVIDAVIFHMTRQGDVIDASNQARPILRLAPELLVGTGLFDRIHLSDRLAYLNALADMREGANSRKLDLRIRLPQTGDGAVSGNYRPFSLEMMATGSDADFIAMLRENDEIDSLREALQEAGESAAAADVAKSRFLAAVSHELRTPLNAIIGFSDMLLHEMFGSFSDPRQKEYVGLVRDSGHHLLEVVTSILDVSRIEAGVYAVRAEPFRFSEAVDMCRSMMQVLAEGKRVDLVTRILPDVGEINADRRAVQQILINLASNAIKFTPAGGEVSIGAQRIGSRLHFWVRDTGIGIAESDLANLGKPFMQVQNDYTRQYEGTGLGLSLVKGLVALHEGTMSVESAPGEGTTVSISLPVEGPAGDSNKLVVLPQVAAGVKEEGRDGKLRKTA